MPKATKIPPKKVGKPVSIKTSTHGALHAPISKIRVLDWLNTRKNVKPDGLDTVETLGVINPIHVRWSNRSKASLDLIDGERRYNAAIKFGLKTIPIHNHGFISDEEALIISYTANDGQKDWTKGERIKGVRKLAGIGMQKDRIAATLRMSKDYVANALRVEKKGSKKMKKAVEKAIEEGGVDTRAAARASKLPEQDQDELVEEIAGKTRDEALEKVAEREKKAGVTSRGPRMAKPKRAEPRDPPKRKCTFQLLPNADELCEAMEVRLRRRLSHNAIDRESNAQLQVLEVLKGKVNIADVFGWED